VPARTSDKADVTHLYHETFFTSLYLVQDIFHVCLGARASIFEDGLRCYFCKIEEGFAKDSVNNEKKIFVCFRDTSEVYLSA